jgi:excisionase family DNA binding protein
VRRFAFSSSSDSGQTTAASISTGSTFGSAAISRRAASARTSSGSSGANDASLNLAQDEIATSELPGTIAGEMTTDVQTQRLLTVREAAEFLSVSEKTVRRLIDARILPAFQTRPHGAIRIDERELEEWLRES